MSRRLDKTLADYVGIAISPVLIMVLVGSLVYFLLEVFYHGQYAGRLHWVFFWFTIGIVLVGRIAIQQGKERAQMFAGPLAIVTVLAMARFAEVTLVTLFLVGLIWWAAHKLTWDCTMFDEEEESSGEGLLHTVGLDEHATAGTAHAEPIEEPEGVTSREAEPSSWWERFWERFWEGRRRAHAPGVWIVYFSLAALPIFGIGQLFVRKDDLASRRYVFLLLLLYVASGLGLLLTTSFLGLRRYLRQRRLQMPVTMAGLWIAIGCALIVALLVLAAILPRPNAEYDLAELSLGVGSSPRESSEYAMKDGEAAEKDEGGPRTGTRQEDQETQDEAKDDGRESTGGPNAREGGTATKPQQDESDSSAASQDSDDGKKSGGKTKGKTSSSGSKTDSQDSQGSKSDERGSKSGSKQGQRKSEGGREKQDQGSGSKTKPQREASGGRSGRSQKRDSGQERKDDEPSDSQTEDDDDQGSASSNRRWLEPGQTVRNLGAWIGRLLKWVIYAALILIAVWWLWRNWAQVLRALRGLLEGWRAFWQRLFGARGESGETGAAAEEEAQPAPPRPFSSFSDPFATGRADSYSPDELVRYTFEALEAWAREHGYPRQPDQTPHEFAQAVGVHVTPLAEPARRLADLYCRVAYAPGTLARNRTAPLEQLWRELREREWARV